MQQLKMFALLALANLKKLYVHFFKGGIFIVVPWYCINILGFNALALAGIIFFWSALACPTVERKDYHLLKFWCMAGSLAIFFSWIVIKLVLLVQYNWLLVGIVLPFMVYMNFYILDSGLHVHRLLYAPLGILKMYWHTLRFCLPLSMLCAVLLLASYSLPGGMLVFNGIVVPIIIVLLSLIYYKQLYAEFKEYYA